MTSLLITGGTGTFGYGFTRHALDHGLFDRICLYSRGEHAQAAMRQTFKDDERLRFFVGDVRDLNRLTRAMDGVDVVIHAAALKHIMTGAYNPTELVNTNILGTINVVEAARRASVKKLVFLSTDKAVSAISPYGHSKALAEWICLSSNVENRLPLISATRYGNVSGSQGSVIPLWRALLKNGITTLPVSDPEVTRFWMTINQAVEMIANVINTMRGGELVIPELPAYRLGDLAVAMGARDIKVTGLSRVEKRHEYMDDDKCSATARRMTIDEIKEALKYV